MPDVTVTLHQPAALGVRPSGGTVIETYRHIPGSVLRGALAAAWIRRHGAPATAAPQLRETFTALFERGVRFGPLLAPGWDFVPLSVLRCKYRSKPGCQNFFKDTAVDAQNRTAALESRCTICQGPLTAGKGDAEPVTAQAQADGPGVIRTTRVQLTERETAKDGMLFTRAALAHRRRANGSARTLAGRIIGGGDWLLGTHRIQLGGRRSTSGDATCEVGPGHTVDDIGRALLDGQRLVLRLLSPAVFVDDFGRATDRPDRTELERLLGIEVPEPTWTWTRHEQVGGWHAASRLPKPSEYTACAGSVYEYELGQNPGPDALRRLVEHGVGLRRAEGFGWIALGPWTPPESVKPAQDPNDRTRPELLEEALADFVDRGLLNYFKDRLKDLERNEAAAREDHSLLTLRRVRELPLQRFRAVNYVLDLDAKALGELCRRLEQRMRGVR